MSERIKVGVVMGGRSPEHKVSLESGRMVVGNLDLKKYDVFPIVIPEEGKPIDLNSLIQSEVVFIAIHGPFGEDGRIQGLLEYLEKPYTGSDVLASALAMDKVMFKRIMRAEGILAPEDSNRFQITDKFPCFVKPADQGSSVGASIAKDEQELARAIEKAQKYSDNVLIEEYIEGIELTCAILGNKNPIALPLVEIVPKKGMFFDYQSKYEDGGSDEIVPARISDEMTEKIQEIALRVYKILGLRGFGRIDFILKGETAYVLEANTIPGLTPASLFPKAARAAGISFSELLNKLIYYAQEK